MAGKIPAGTFNTRISLDGDQSVKTLRQLKTEVSALTGEWKAQSTELASAGDKLGAAKAKYEGLSASVKHQKEYIAQLRAEQSKLDTSTTKGGEDFAKMEKQIVGATTKLQSMTAQQGRAKDSLDYYKSGVAEAQKELERIGNTSKAYVERLKAEGKQTQANRAEAENLGKQYDKMSTIYRAQATELKKIEAASGKTSEAYAKQSIRVNETATKMAEAKNRMNQLDDAMKKANPGIFTRLKTAIGGVNEKAEKTQSIFKNVFSANILSSAVQNVWGHLSSWIGSAVDSAKEYSLAQQTMNATWTTLTGNAKSGQDMADMTNSMAIAANNATDMVDGMNQKFYAISKNADTTKALTKSVLTLQDAFGASDAAVENFGTQFAQMMANGKVGAQDMMSFVNTFPVLRTNLLKTERQITGNHKLSMQQMNDLMSQGKISSDTMEKVLKDTAKQYGSATENFGHTIPGMIRTVKSQMPVLLSAISTPLTTAANPLIGTMSDWVASSKTKAKFTSIGKTFSAGLTKAINAFGGGKDSSASLVSYLNRGLEGLQKTISGTFDYLAKHAKDIKGIAGDTWQIVKLITGGAWDVFKSTLKTVGDLLGVTGKNGKKAKDPLQEIHAILDWMVKHRDGVKAFGGVLAGLWMTSKVLTFGKALKGVYSTLKAIAGSKLATGVGSTIKNVTSNALSGNSFGGALSTVKGAGGWSQMTKLGKVATGAAGVGVGIDAGLDIYKAFTDTDSKAKYQDAGSGIGKALGGGIGLAFGGPMGAALGAAIGGVAGKRGGTAAKGFMSGWDKVKGKKPDDWLGKLGYDAHKGVSGIKKWWDKIQKENQKAQAKMEKKQKAANKKQQKAWDDFWSGVRKGTKSWLDKTSKDAKAGVNKVKTNITDKFDDVKTGLDKTFKSTKKSFGKWLGGFEKDARTMGLNEAIGKQLDGVKSKISKWGKAQDKSWSKKWKSFKKTASDNFDGVKESASDWGDSTAKWWSKWKKGFGKNWKNGWKSFADGTKDNLKKAKTSVSDWGENVSTWWSKWKTNFGKNWKSGWKYFKGSMSDYLDSAKSKASDWGDKVESWRSRWSTKFSKGWKSTWNGISTFFSSIFSGIAIDAKKGMNSLIGIVNGAIGGINWLWRKFTGKNALGKIQKLAQGGIVGKMHMVMVNDGPGPDWKELFQLPNGAMGMLHGRNAVTALPEGTRVYNGRETKSLMSAAGIEHYAKGGWVGAIGSFFNGVGDKLEAVTDWLAHPIKNVENLLAKYTSGLTAITSTYTELGKGVVSKMASGVSSWMKSKLKAVEDMLSPANPTGSGVTRWKPSVIKALKANGFDATASQVSAWLRVIQRESGGNPHAINLWDSNAKAGVPSMGLVQTIMPTFNAYKFPGHGNIQNGYDDLLAGIHYAKSRYGSGPSMFARVSGPLGYANGGFASTPSIFGEAGVEAAVPLSAVKRSRGYEMLGKTAAAMAARDGIGESGGSGVSAQLDQLIELMTTLVSNGITETIEAHFNAYLDKRQMAKEMAPVLKVEMARQQHIENGRKGIRD
ncbi:tape measure protein [Lacticaseibacillus parakribbianus]|uniref:tape measure protein n=1 Tax=Lacticaseibacillus parakribbianus TaxID=2970927 RepID=UPI0021CB2A13|nr:tape measure protein [Lacticaseibacillus parakribbianus]